MFFFLLAMLFLLLACVLGFLLWFANQKAEEREVGLEQKIQELSTKNRQLAPYEGIVAVDREIEHRRTLIAQEEANSRAQIQIAQQEVHQFIQHQRHETEQFVFQQKQETEEYVKQQRKEINELKRTTGEQQSNILNVASQESARVVELANQRADEIAGDAMRALRDSRQLEATAKAMKNIIMGYGDEYLVPNVSLLDDLAEEYSHKEAGVELKTARERARQMVNSGLAANCDYAETKRKETAIHFVLDAFNGKIDSILSRVKHDNFGKLDQEITDAFNLVNYNGEAFRNARIEQQYMEARRSELRWAVAVNELRRQEREEQRKIKEEMREEERARKEYEKAIKQAAKEERLLEEAMEKARREMQSASEEQRAEYERQLLELEQKWKEAEERNKRAKSMAEQTKQGHVYVISNVGSFGDDVFKIGLTRRLQPTDRVKELGDASVPFEFDVHAMMFDKDAPALEARLHNIFRASQVNLVNPRKEFFRLGIAEIKKAVKEIGIEAKWTMVADAHEYRETLAVLKAQGKDVRELPPPEPKPEPISPSVQPVAPPTHAAVAVSLPLKEQAPEPAAASPVFVQPRVSHPSEFVAAALPPQVEPASPGQPGLAHAQPAIGPHATATVQTPKKLVPCPGCKTTLDLSSVEDGRITCKRCHRSFRLR